MAATQQKKLSLVHSDMKKIRRAMDENYAQSLEEVKDLIAGGEFFQIKKLAKPSRFDPEDLMHLLKYSLSCHMESIAVLLVLALRKGSAATNEEAQYVRKAELAAHESELVQRLVQAWKHNETSDVKQVKKEVNKAETALLKSPIYRVYDEATEDVKQSTTDVIDKEFNTLIHMATLKQQTTLVHAYGLLGVPPNAQNKDGDTALHLVARMGDIELAEALLMVGVNPTLKNKMGLTAADVALQRNQAAMADLLTRNSPGLVQGILNGSLRDVSRAIKRWSSPLAVPIAVASSLAEDSPIFKSVRNAADNVVLAHRILANDTRAARRMLHQPSKSGPRLNLNLRHPDSGMTLLAAAVRNGNHLLVSDLLTHGATSCIRIHREPLIVLAVKWKCSVDIISLLLQYDPNNWTERDHQGRTVFLAAVEDGRSVDDVVSLVRLSHGLCLAQRNSKKQTALEWCQEHGETLMLEALQLEIQFLFTNVNAENKAILMQLAVSYFGKENFRLPESPGATYDKFMDHLVEIENRGLALMIAAASGDLDEVKRLNDAAFVDRSGYTALTRALVHDRYNIVLWLITERPILKTMTDVEGRNVLHYAYAMPDYIGAKYVKLLLDQNTESLETKPDKNDVVPCVYANLRGTPKIENMLKSVLLTDVSGKSSLMHREATIINF